MSISKDCRFSLALKRAIEYKYGKVPSVSFLTNQFNLNLPKKAKPITDECFRRWLKGKSKPGFQYLEILIDVFKIDPTDIFSDNHEKKNSRRTTDHSINPEEILNLFKDILEKSISNPYQLSKCRKCFLDDTDT